ncbi:MAG: hypothetical protein NTY09_12945 [bacterium]|nr:hypothetical protein [bacterium]
MLFTHRIVRYFLNQLRHTELKARGDRERLISRLAAIGPSAIPLLIPELRGPFPESMSYCGDIVRALVRIGSPAVPALIKELRNNHTGKYYAIDALSQIGGKLSEPAIPLLTEVLEGKRKLYPRDEMLRMSAKALGRIGGPAIALFIGYLHQERRDLLCNALYGLNYVNEQPDVVLGAIIEYRLRLIEDFDARIAELKRNCGLSPGEGYPAVYFRDSHPVFEQFFFMMGETEKVIRHLDNLVDRIYESSTLLRMQAILKETWEAHPELQHNRHEDNLAKNISRRIADLANPERRMKPWFHRLSPFSSRNNR